MTRSMKGKEYNDEFRDTDVGPKTFIYLGNKLFNYIIIDIRNLNSHTEPKSFVFRVRYFQPTP